MRLTIQTKLFLSHFAAIVMVSGSVGTYFYQSATENLMQALQSRLKNSAALVSQGMNGQDLDRMRVETDSELPDYKKAVIALRGFVKSNPDIAFIYVMRKVGNRAFFVIDSDIRNPAMPGEEYNHDIAPLMDGFIHPSVDEEITHDRWGYFLSGYSPLDGGKDDYLLGIDMRADEVQGKFEKIRLAGLLSLSLSVILATFFSRLLSLHLTKRITSLATRFAAIAPLEHDVNQETNGDELDQLSLSYDQMASRLRVKQQQIDANQTALRKAHGEMENRIETRTAELVQTNEKLLQEIAERKHVERMLEETSRIDYLTGVLNRRAMTIRLEQVVSQTERGSNSFCTILLDIDHFKMINDNYGHDVGDHVLRHCVKQMRKCIRESDELGRWGGEEFLILSLDTTLAEAIKLVHRLCDELSATSVVEQSRDIRVTASFGVTQYQSGEALAFCLKRTDDALYAAKAKGRNCVVVAELD